MTERMRGTDDTVWFERHRQQRRPPRRWWPLFWADVVLGVAVALVLVGLLVWVLSRGWA